MATRLYLKISNCSYYLGKKDKYRKGMNIGISLPEQFSSLNNKELLDFFKKQNGRFYFYVGLSSAIIERSQYDSMEERNVVIYQINDKEHIQFLDKTQ